MERRGKVVFVGGKFWRLYNSSLGRLESPITSFPSESEMPDEISLRYGSNSHQTPARAYVRAGDLPFRILNGSVGYINLLDALNSWQLVRELRQATGLAAAASFKHVSPSGAALSLPLSEPLRKAYRMEDLELSPVATAYARARGADRLCSFGDWVAVSDVVDVSLARVLQREVSDGIVAPGYEAEALSILSQKKQGGYVILQMNSDYGPPLMQTREVFGVTLEEKRNEVRLDQSALKNVVTRNAEFTAAAQRDALVALITLKYTQSNSVCLATDGQTIGIGAGQQSRIHCTRLACAKADLWRLRQHPATIGLPFRSGLRRPDQDNGIDLYLRDDVTETELEQWNLLFEQTPARLKKEQRQQWLDNFRSAVLGSDGYIPFRDSIDRAVRSGVRWVVQPGGSNRDVEVIAACDEYEVAMAFTGIRLFHH
jgi:phosphoribosylaminoimidazolecarboxamide formyltransferase / IMP cyclohydrolase